MYVEKVKFTYSSEKKPYFRNASKYHLMAEDGLTACGKSFYYATTDEELPINHPLICVRCLENRKYMYG